MKRSSLFIQKLDEGFTITENGKTKAIESKSALQNHIVQKMLEITNRMGHAGVQDMILTLETEENVPKQGT